MYAKIENGQVVQVGLPQTGIINGQAVSGYNLLAEEVLKVEGWFLLEENRPTYDEEKQILESQGYDIQSDKVIANYVVVEKPAEEPSVEDRVSALEDVMLSIL